MLIGTKGHGETREDSCVLLCPHGMPRVCPQSHSRLACCLPPSRLGLSGTAAYKAEVLLVLTDSLHLWSVQDSLIIRHGLLCIFLVLFLGKDSKKQGA